MESFVLSISSAFILIAAIWSLFKFRDWQYTRHAWTVWKHEDMIFLSGLIIGLTMHSMLTSSNYTATLSTAPWTIIAVKIYQIRQRAKA
jgi:hypothetical protein